MCEICESGTLKCLILQLERYYSYDTSSIVVTNMTSRDQLMDKAEDIADQVLNCNRCEWPPQIVCYSGCGKMRNIDAELE